MIKNLFVAAPAPASSPLELDSQQIKLSVWICLMREFVMILFWHVYKFVKICEGLSVCDVCNDIIKAKWFPHTLQGDAKEWVIKWHKNSSWCNLRSAFMEKIGYPKNIRVGLAKTLEFFLWWKCLS
jgi:hypothetical protein